MRNHPYKISTEVGIVHAKYARLASARGRGIVFITAVFILALFGGGEKYCIFYITFIFELILIMPYKNTN